ncbi:MAG: polysulfide reductase NrfD [Alphaproteobacteria bacterium]|nr:polysulfide reductase NrfD [Alphaproteobacteria bacterium]
MNYGFAIDTRSCIGCHACSTACKSENQVPLGVNRTWVKYTETGTYPDVRRNFQVTRCNHCSNPPCVRICPVTAMYQRDDGIVEFDGDVCIGCKGCMQACPYDAIYIDPETKTAAKCHYCGHRVENGLEPACVVVCPTHSIIAGDMDDPQSEISRVLAKNDVTVRKPEQGTSPKLFYVQGNDVAMHPTALPRHPDGMIWAETLDGHGHNQSLGYDTAARYEVKLDLSGGASGVSMVPTATADSGVAIRTPGTQALPGAGPINIQPGRMAGQMVSYNAQHLVPWHWQVPAYLVTKGIGAGGFLLMALGVLGLFELSPMAAFVGGTIGLVGLVATTLLLVFDLERPERFLRIVFRPQMKSWLARGAFILIAFSNVAALWWAMEGAVAFGLVDAMPMARTVLAVLSIPLAIGTAIYTAFLFAQCEGRDLWQSPLLPFHLLVQAVMMGGASLALAAVFVPLLGASGGPEMAAIARWALVGGIVTDLFVTLFGEFGVAHASELAARAAHEISHGKFKTAFWAGSVTLGHVVPLVLLILTGNVLVGALAAVLTAIGLYAYEHAFVMAPQELPNS